MVYPADGGEVGLDGFQGRGVIFVGHHLQDVFAVPDRIVVLRRGSLAGERRTEATTHDEVVKLMIGG